MRKLKRTNLYEFLKEYDLTERSSDYFKEVLNFEIDRLNPDAETLVVGATSTQI